MRHLLLCRERLRYLLRILDRADGKISLRDLQRTYGIHGWETAQAESYGWVTITQLKPRVGRPSFLVKKVSDCIAAKLPPNRWDIPVPISIRHWNFVFAYLGGVGICKARAAYLASFPAARSKAGASASASRLLKHPDVKAALAWIRACSESGLPSEVKDSLPDSAAEIREIFILYNHGRRYQL